MKALSEVLLQHNYEQSALPENVTNLDANHNQINPHLKNVVDKNSVKSRQSGLTLYGFSGKNLPETQSSASNGFPLINHNSNFSNHLEEASEIYRKSIRQVEFYGPTQLGPTISQISQDILAADKQRNKDKLAIAPTSTAPAKTRSTYNLLILLTNGAIVDVSQTIDAILNNLEDPISILVIGVGQICFKNVHVLDGSEFILTNSLKTLSSEHRVNSQFVRMQDYIDEHGKIDREGFLHACLDDLPSQLSVYYKMKPT